MWSRSTECALNMEPLTRPGGCVEQASGWKSAGGRHRAGTTAEAATGSRRACGAGSHRLRNDPRRPSRSGPAGAVGSASAPGRRPSDQLHEHLSGIRAAPDSVAIAHGPEPLF